MAPSRMVNYDIAPLQRLLQHSSAAITQRYIGIEPQRIEKAIEEHVFLFWTTIILLQPTSTE